MSKLKLAFLAYRSDPFSGGQGIYLKNVTEALLERGHQITIYSGRPLPDVSDDIDLVPIETPGYFESFDFNQRFKNFLKQPKTSMEILDFFETCTGTFTEPIFFGDRLLKNDHFIKHQDSFDIFHDNQSLSNYSKIINNRLVTTLHHPIHVDRDIDLENEPGFLRRFSIKRWYSFLNFQKKNVKNIKAIVSPSESSKRDIVKFFDCSESKIKVIWNGVDIATPEQNNQKEFKNHFVTIVSADVPMKNLENILKAIAIAKKELPNIKLTVIGDMREGNKDLINNLNIESNIDYKEKLSRAELLSCLNEADIGISASLYEGFGFPLVEMISSELPVIVANKGSLPELAGNAGIIFDAERASSLAEKMIELASNHDLRNELKDQSKFRRGDFFGWDEYAIKLESLYQEIIHGNF